MSAQPMPPDRPSSPGPRRARLRRGGSASPTPSALVASPWSWRPRTAALPPRAPPSAARTSSTRAPAARPKAWPASPWPDRAWRWPTRAPPPRSRWVPSWPATGWRPSTGTTPTRSPRRARRGRRPASAPSSTQPDARASPPDTYESAVGVAIAAPTALSYRWAAARARCGPVAAQHGEQLVVRADQVRLVVGLEPGRSARRVVEDRAVGGAAQREHAGAGRELVHPQAVQPAARGDGEPGDEQRLVARVESGEHVEAEGRADEPRGGERCGGPDVPEPERLLHRVGELRVEDAQRDGNGGPARPELVAHGESGLEVGQVVAGQHRDGGRGGQPGGREHLGQRSVGDQHGDVERAQLPEVPVVLVHLHHHDVAARVAQLPHHAQPDRAEPDHQHVVAQHGDLLPPE